MSLRQLFVVARKELTDGFRDKRAIYSIIFGSVLGPIMIGFMLSQEASQEKAAQEISIPVVGKANSPMLVNWLTQQTGVTIKDGPTDAEKAVRDSVEDYVLVIDKDFAGNFRASRPAPVKIISNSGRMSTHSKVRRLRALLARFNAEMASLRLVARGINPAIATPIKMEDVEISTAAQRAAMLFNLVSLYLLIGAVTAGLQFASDATAGERERLSLEALLINPVPRWQLLAGKWLSAVVAAFIGMTTTLVLTAMILARLSLEDLGVRIHLGWAECLLILATVSPLGFLIPALQVYLSCFAKTFKEAQGYMVFMMIFVVVPSMLPIFHPLGNNPLYKVIPFLGQSLMANDVIAGVPPNLLLFTASAVIALGLTAIFLWLATRLFSSEKIIFGR